MVESAMTSVERVLYYSHEIPQEAAMTSDELDDVKDGTSFCGKKAIHTTKEWPESGSVTLSNLQMRYRTETPLVLKGLNVSIGAGERIGVVGRTGSGKSSMLLVLMRIVEPLISDGGEKYEAPLSIDGVDVMRIGLYDLRSKLGIIPQSPGESIHEHSLLCFPYICGFLSHHIVIFSFTLYSLPVLIAQFYSQEQFVAILIHFLITPMK